jgi:hypothetical protein
MATNVRFSEAAFYARMVVPVLVYNLASNLNVDQNALHLQTWRGRIAIGCSST